MKSISKVADIRLDIQSLTFRKGDLGMLGSRCGGSESTLPRRQWQMKLPSGPSRSNSAKQWSGQMSAFGTKRTSRHAQPMSAFGGLTDSKRSTRKLCRCLLHFFGGVDSPDSAVATPGKQKGWARDTGAIFRLLPWSI